MTSTSHNDRYAELKLRHMREASRLRSMTRIFPMLDTVGNADLIAEHLRAAEILDRAIEREREPHL